MATLNHTNLTTYNVPALTDFFSSVFDFQVMHKRGDKLAVLRNSDGFLLTLMYDKRMTPEHGYPALFHVGFLQPTQHAVDIMHEALSARDYTAPRPARLQRGGPDSIRLLLRSARRCAGGSKHDEHYRTSLAPSEREAGESLHPSLIVNCLRLREKVLFSKRSGSILDHLRN